MANILYPNTGQINDGPSSLEIDENKITEIEEIQSSIKAGYAVLCENDENAVLVIGRTGAGKSTLVNYLIRPNAMRGIEKESGRRQRLVIDADEQDGYPTIRHGCDAETRIPNKCYDQKNSVAYWDCPGFGDTGGPVKDIPNAFFIKRVFEKAKNVKILLVIEVKDFNSRADTIKTLVDDLTNLFVSVDIIKDAVSLIVTKVDENYDANSVESDISNMLSAKCFEKSSTGQELLKMLLKGDTAEDKTGVLVKSKVSVFKKPKEPGLIGLDNYNEIIEVVNGTIFAPSPPVKVPVSQGSMNYAIHLGSEVKKKLIGHIDELREEIVRFCSIRSRSVEEINFIEIYSLVEEIPKIKSTLNVALKCDRVDTLKSSVLAHVDNINNILANRATSLDVTELSEKIERDSNYLIFLGSINKNVDLICNPFAEIYSRMNDGKLQIEDNLKLISSRVQARLNIEKDAMKALVSSIKDNLVSCIIKDEIENKLSSGTKVAKCKEYFDTMQDLKRICTKITDPDSAFKVIIDTLESELIKKYKLEVPQRAADAIAIYINLSLLDSWESMNYKKSFQQELANLFDEIERLYREQISSIHGAFGKDVSRIIKDFGDKLDGWLAEFTEQNDKETYLTKIGTIVNILTDNKSDPLTIVRNLQKMLGEINVNDAVLRCLDQLSTTLYNFDELIKLFDNLESYLCEIFYEKLNKLSTKLDSKYNSLINDISIQNNFEHGIMDIIDEIKKYIGETNLIESSVERLKKVNKEVDSLINEFKDNTVISDHDFLEKMLIAFQSVNEDFKCKTKAGDVKSNVITNLILLRGSLKDDIKWYQSTLPEIFLKLNDPNFADKIYIKEITKENFREFFTKFKKVDKLENLMFNDALEIEFSEDRKKQLNALLNAVKGDKMEYGYNGSELSIKGNCIRISEIQHLVNEDVKRIKIKSLGSIFFDDDLKANGVDLLIIAPSWHVKSGKNVMIDLSGNTLPKLLKADDGKGYTADGDGQNGSDGLKGLAGNHGGSFYGSGVNFMHLDRLKINVSGGKGQDGQDGGNAARVQLGGTTCRDVDQGSIKEVTWTKLPIESYISLEIFFRYYDKTVKIEGLRGGNGRSAGKGGEGGESGEPGIVKVFNQKERTNLKISSNIIKETGTKGKNGNSGHDDGKHDFDLEVTFHRVCFPWYDNPKSSTVKFVDVNDIVRNGIYENLNNKCSYDHADNDKACSKCLPVKFDEELFNKHVEAFLVEHATFLKNLAQSDSIFHQLLLKDADN